MNEPTLKQILLDYLNKTEGYVTKGQLGLVAEQHGFLPEGAGRVLRKLAEKRPDHEPEILVDYYQGRRKQTLSKYARLNTPKVIKPKIELKEINGQMVAVMS